MVTSVLRKLKPIEQEVIKYLFGIGHMREYEMREVADKMNFSAERIRQIRNTALDKMKNEYLKLAESI
jgi:DNA-directed RNA polymerase sigma subunit (sigma70/sigma32)